MGITLLRFLCAPIAAIPFESPKLQATATLQLGLDFASKLDRAVMRSAKVKLVARDADSLVAQSA